MLNVKLTELMQKYALINELEEQNTNLLQKSSSQSLEIAELKSKSMEWEEKLRLIKEENNELTEKVFTQNAEIQATRLDK